MRAAVGIGVSGRGLSGVGWNMFRQTANVKRVVDGSFAVHGDSQCPADFMHPFDAEDANALNQYADRHTLDRVKIHRAPAPDRIITGLQDDLAHEATDCRRAWSD